MREEGDYRKGRRNGHWAIYNKTGIKDSEGDYEDERPDGLWLYYYETGVKFQEKHYKDGALDGECKTWYENAALQSIAHYKVSASKAEEVLLDQPRSAETNTERHSSKPDGDWIYYDQNGKELMHVRYKNGEKVK